MSTLMANTHCGKSAQLAFINPEITSTLVPIVGCELRYIICKWTKYHLEFISFCHQLALGNLFFILRSMTDFYPLF